MTCPTVGVCPPCREGWGHWTPSEGRCGSCDVTGPHYCPTQQTELPRHWIGGTVIGSRLDYPQRRLSILVETPDGTIVRVTGNVEIWSPPQQTPHSTETRNDHADGK